MAAALETLHVVNDVDLPAKLKASGDQLRTGWQQQSQAAGFGLRQTGPGCMPMVLFHPAAQPGSAPDAAKKAQQLGFRFCELALDAGLYLHPWHNMFLSLAHTDAVIDEILEKSAQVFAALRAEQ